MTVITPCAWCGAKPLASINSDACVCACMHVCVCVTEGESSISRDGDVAGNASATVARPRQPEPPLHRPRLSPPSYSPSISLCSPHLQSPPSSYSIPPSETKTKASASYYSMTLKLLFKQDNAILLFVSSEWSP